MPGLANGWNVAQLNRAPGQLWVGLAIPAVDGIMSLDAGGNPDSTANPNGKSVGYTNEGWTFATSPTFDEVRVDEEENAVQDFITTTTATISGAIRQVKNLPILAAMTPGSLYTAPAAGVEKLSGGGLATFSYTCCALVWQDPNVPDNFYWVMLYRAINTSGLDMGIGRTKDSAVNVTLSGRAVSGRTAGDRTWILVKKDFTP